MHQVHSDVSISPTPVILYQPYRFLWALNNHALLEKTSFCHKLYNLYACHLKKIQAHNGCSGSETRVLETPFLWEFLYAWQNFPSIYAIFIQILFINVLNWMPRVYKMHPFYIVYLTSPILWIVVMSNRSNNTSKGKNQSNMDVVALP